MLNVLDEIQKVKALYGMKIYAYFFIPYSALTLMGVSFFEVPSLAQPTSLASSVKYKMGEGGAKI